MNQHVPCDPPSAAPMATAIGVTQLDCVADGAALYSPANTYEGAVQRRDAPSSRRNALLRGGDESGARLLRGVGAAAVAFAAGCAGLGSLPENRPPAEDEVPQAYGTTAKSSVTSNGSSFVVDEMEKARYSRIEDMLVRVPGLRVLRSASGGIALQLRGNGAATGEPLLMIDGLPIHDAAGSALATLHPREVVRIDVLKDVSAAIYGIRGGNGVVIITTRRGR